VEAGSSPGTIFVLQMMLLAITDALTSPGEIENEGFVIGLQTDNRIESLSVSLSMWQPTVNDLSQCFFPLVP
jgi:hypothetical protein